MKLLKLIITTTLIVTYIIAGTTGKIKGRVTDEEGTPLPGANIIIENTVLGAATDGDGNYYILNVPPGDYTVRVMMIGYSTMIIEQVIIQSDLSTEINARLSIKVLESEEEVTVIASRSMIQKDATASAAIIGADVIENSPIESFQAIVQTKAGVTVDAGGELHFRGGRSSEVSYLIDGIPNVNPFHQGLGVDISTNAIQELSVITGSFSAEYGQAMSGVVNIVTKDPSNMYRGSLSIMGGDMYTNYSIEENKTIKKEIAPYDPENIREVEASLSGPIPIFNNIKFFTSLRGFNRGGTLFGVTKYNSIEQRRNAMELGDTLSLVQTKDQQRVFSLNPNDKLNFQSKLTYYLNKTIKFQYTLLHENNYWKSYSHSRRFIKDGHLQNNKVASNHIFIFNHQLGIKTFYSIGFSHAINRYQYYAYKKIDDLRYVSSDYYRQDDNYEFYTGGTNNTRYDRLTTTNLIQGHLTTQIGDSHEFKTGIEVRQHDFQLEKNSLTVDLRDEPWDDINRNGNYDEGEPFNDINGNGVWNNATNTNGDEIPGNAAFEDDNLYANSFHNKPVEISAFIQDKIELPDMVLNVGLRYDYYNPDGKVALDWNNPQKDEVKDATPKTQISPRFSLAFPITTEGKLFFSYGHFFQMPSYKYLFENAEFNILKGVIKTDVGNADLKPQKTISYEVGVEQALTLNSAIYLKLFYRDMRNLLGQKIYVLPGGSDSYALFINRDWGNTKGVTVSFDQRFTHFISGSIDYTYMVAVGNESDPTSTRTDYRLSTEPLRKVVPLSWDQTHAFRFVLNIGKPGNWKISSIGKIESGYPYTPSDVNATVQVAEENSGRKPTRQNLDITAYKSLKFNDYHFQLFIKIYNVFDYQNQNYVWDSSGSADYSLGRFGDESTPQWINRPNWYSTPRRVYLGIKYEF
ncbi:MAG: TonB-dependent receptor domain-containing protein [Fidelibacterota bacterium]